MGICLQLITSKGAGMKNTETFNLTTDWVWVCLRRDPTKSPVQWHIQGVAANEGLAIEMCADENYLIGPIPINTSLPVDRIEWIGSYFPYKTPK